MSSYSTDLPKSSTSIIEPGDYIPYFYINNSDRILDIQAKAGQFILLVTFDLSIDREEIENNLDYSCEYLQFFIGNRNHNINHKRLFIDDNVYHLLKDDRNTKYQLLLCDRNLKGIVKLQGDNYSELLAKLPAKSSLESTNISPPILIVPDAISASLATELIQYLEQNTDNAHQDNRANKSRNHVHPSKELIADLDIKLSKSLLPEINKVFYSDITHRETYKITSYDGNYSGRFHRHRDTIEPFLHRRYALSLLLNDDYQGGGLCFPEYGDKIVTAPKYSAIIFPGSLYHEVKPIETGKRYALISFFFTVAEARLKPNSDRYKFTHTRELNGVKTKQITPKNSSELKTPPLFGVRNWSIITKPIDFNTNLARMSFEQIKVVENSNNQQSKISNKTITKNNKEIPTVEISDPPTAANFLALAEQALAQSLLSKTEQYLKDFDRAIAENKVDDSLINKRKLLAEELIKECVNKNNFLVTIAGDSLSLPRPWYLKKFDPELNPFLATKYFDTYPQILENILSDRLSFKKVRVNNSLAQRGFNITSLTARLPDIFSYYDPDLVIIQVGIVDCWRRGENLDKQDVPLPKYLRHLQKIIDYRDKACPNKPLILMGLCPTDPKLYKRNSGMNQIIEEYNNAIRDAIKSKVGITFFNTGALMNMDDPYSLIHRDGIHFSTSGHTLIAKALGNMIVNIVNRKVVSIN